MRVWYSSSTVRPSLSVVLRVRQYEAGGPSSFTPLTSYQHPNAVLSTPITSVLRGYARTCVVSCALPMMSSGHDHNHVCQGSNRAHQSNTYTYNTTHLEESTPVYNGGFKKSIPCVSQRYRRSVSCHSGSKPRGQWTALQRAAEGANDSREGGQRPPPYAKQ